MRGVAAFDYDGTLARGDSLVPFLSGLLGKRKVTKGLLAHSIPLAMIGLGRGNRDETKERFLAHMLTGHPESSIRKAGEDFASEVAHSGLFERMRERIEWHREQSHHLVMVSATLDVYLRPLADLLGFDDLLCTHLEVVDGKVTGKLIGVNVRAAEKARQLQALLGDTPYDLWAYGNSSGDYDMLQMAQHPFWVDRAGRMEPWKHVSD